MMSTLPSHNRVRSYFCHEFTLSFVIFIAKLIKNNGSSFDIIIQDYCCVEI